MTTPDERARVTVIVPSSNSGPFVAATVQSALAQHPSVVEVLVVDDGSSDDGPIGLSALDDARVRVLCQPRRGLARTLNLALGLARTPWVSVLPPHDVLAPGWLAALLPALQAAPAPGAVFVQPAFVDAFGEATDDPAARAPFAAPAIPASDIRLALLERNFLCFSGALFDRALALRVGGFDPSLALALDHDLWLRLLAEAPPLVVPQRLVEVTWRGVAGEAGKRATATAERAYVVAKAVAGWHATTDRPLTEADEHLELARRVLRSGVGGAPGIAAELVARARLLGADVPVADADLASLRELFPFLSTDPAHAASRRAPRVLHTLGTVPSSLRIALEVATLDRGGLETVVVRLAHALRTAGHLPLVICTERGGAGADAVSAVGIEVVVLSGADRVADLGRVLLERRVEVVNAHFSTFGTRVAAALGIPVISTLHNAYAWLGSGVFDEMRAVDSLLTGYVAVSESVADFCARRFDLDRGRIAVIRNAVEPEQLAGAAMDRRAARQALGIPADCRLLVQVGRIDPIKCQLALVAALRALAPTRPELRAWIVGGIGNPGYAHRVHESIREAGLTERIDVVGERDDVPTILAAADVFVMPSVLEGLSLAAIEAMAAGVPAVLTRTGDAAWLLGEDSVTATAAPLPGALLAGPTFAPHILSERLNEIAASEEPPHAGALANAIAEVLDDLPRRSLRARARAAELALLLAPEAWIWRHLELFGRVAATGAVRRAAALARATHRLTAELDAEQRVREPLDQTLEELSRVLTGHLASQRAASNIATTRGELVMARIAFGEAGEALVRTLDKLRLTNRVRAAWRSLARRRSNGS